MGDEEEEEGVIIEEEKAGIYVPPSRRGEKARTDQRDNWEKLKKTINGTINRLNRTNIKELIHNLFSNANLLRGKGLLCKNIMKASLSSPSYIDLYACIIAVINTKLPEIGELLLK